MIIDKKKYRTRSFNNEDAANLFLEKNPEWGVIKVIENKNTVFIDKRLKIYVAKCSDLGTPIR